MTEIDEICYYEMKQSAILDDRTNIWLLPLFFGIIDDS